MAGHRVAQNVASFAIHAGDVARARRFYQRVFGWRFEPWGPPDFYLIHTGTPEDPGIQGLLQQRQGPAGQGIAHFECTISVNDLDQVRAAVVENGGTIELPPATIPTVGTLIKFRDPEGNLACAMVYETPPGGRAVGG